MMDPRPIMESMIILAGCAVVVARVIFRETRSFNSTFWSVATLLLFGGSVLVACFFVSQVSAVAVVWAAQ